MMISYDVCPMRFVSISNELQVSPSNSLHPTEPIQYINTFIDKYIFCILGYLHIILYFNLWHSDIPDSDIEPRVISLVASTNLDRHL